MINAIAASQKCEPTDLVIVKNGGSDYGTWFHEDLALVFAQWLSPEFYIWYHDKSKYSSKEVDVFRYNQKGFDIIRNIFFNRFG